MLIRIFFFALIVSLVSCSKIGTSEHPKGYVSFSANGTSYAWNEVNDYASPNYLPMEIYTVAPGYYRFSASNEYTSVLRPLRLVNLTIQANSLVTNTPFTYSNATATDPIYPPHQISVSDLLTNDLFSLYSAYEIGDFATVTFTSIHDQMADGNFSARMTRLSDSAKINITSGSFKNVKISP